MLKRVAEDTPRNIREIIPETPQWLCDIIAKLHAKNPDDRFQSAREVADVLADCEAQLKANSKLQDFSRIPRGSSAAQIRSAEMGCPGGRRRFFSAIALAQLEFAGVTHLFGGKPTTDPIQPGGEPAPIQVTKLGGPEAEGWVQLFNGKDLTGWKFHLDHPGNWEVKDGVLSGSKRQSHLFSERADYGNFHLRAEVKINLGGDSGIMFRAPFELRPGRTPSEFGVPGCYEAELHKNRSHALPTGSISETTGDAPPTSLGRVLDSSLTEPDEWFTYEVIAENNQFITKINGSEAANCNDPQGRHQTGHLALQVWHANTLVQFRKIEIKELPANPPVTEGFVSLFNGKDLTGWKTHSLSGGDWRVEDGAIDGRGSTSYLFSESGDYADFHLRVEAKINGNGDAGVYIRTPFDVQGLPNTGPAKFALLAGYEAAIALRANYPTHTGSLTAADGSTLHAGPLMPHEPDEWFVLEVIAEDNHIRTLVDGKPAADYHDENRRSTRGHIALQTWGPNITSVQFRKIEIKELPASAASLPPTYKNSLGMPEVKTPPVAASPFTDADVQRIASLPAEQQVAAVVASLKERNPGLNGTASHKIVDGVVTEFNFNPTDDQNALTDLSPVRALAGLTSLNLWNCSALADLGPLQGLPLTRLLIGSLNVSNQVRDLKPLQGMRLTELQLYQCQVEDLQPLAGMPLNKLRVLSRQVRDCEPLKGMPLTTLDLSYCTQIEDFTPLTGLPLTVLHLNACQIRDLQPLLGLKLTEVSLAGTRVQDLEQLKGMPLKNLAIHRTGVTDLTPLQGMELKEIFLTPKNITHGLNHLRDMQSLNTIGIGYTSNEKWPAVEFWERYDKEEFAPVPFTEADAQRIAALPAAEQVEEVRKELMRRNPGFDGQVGHRIEDDVVVELSFVTDQVSDISPVRALTGLKSLSCSGSDVGLGQLSASALLPLKGLPLTQLDFRDSPPVSDLAALAGMKLTSLDCRATSVGDADLKQLAGMNDLQMLSLWGTKVTDAGLKELAGLKNLQHLSLQTTKVTDAGLKEIVGLDKLVYLDLYALSGVTDAGLEHLARLKTLKHLDLRGPTVKDADVDKLASARPALRILTWDRVIEPKVVPFTDADAQRIAALPAAEQVEEVRKELQRLNPGFDGKLTPTIENDVVTELSVNTDQITNIAPVRALTKLIYLDCRGTYPNKGKLSDLSPIKGMKLSRIDCSSTQIADLTPLAGMPLTYLHFNHNPVSDLAPLQGMPLLELGTGGNQGVRPVPFEGHEVANAGGAASSGDRLVAAARNAPEGAGPVPHHRCDQPGAAQGYAVGGSEPPGCSCVGPVATAGHDHFAIAPLAGE